MFEKKPPFSDALESGSEQDRVRASDPLVGSEEAAPARVGEALRSLDWGELSARLGAARDLRIVLQNEAQRNEASHNGGFAQAAERYFRAKDNGKRAVNPVALEQSKGSPCITVVGDQASVEKDRERENAKIGDAREY